MILLSQDSSVVLNLHHRVGQQMLQKDEFRMAFRPLTYVNMFVPLNISGPPRFLNKT